MNPQFRVQTPAESSGQRNLRKNHRELPKNYCANNSLKSGYTRDLLRIRAISHRQLFSIETMLQAQVFCLVSRPAAFKRRTMAVFSTDLSQTVEVLLERKNYNSVKDILSTVNPADIAVIFRDQPAQRLLMLFRLLPKETAADVFVEMEPVLQEQLINAFSDKELADIVNEMYADDAADLVEEMPASVVKRILKQASPDVRRDINELLKYPEDSAGSIMTPEFADLHSSMTAAEALDHIRLTGVDKETIDICYVIEKRKLIGLVSLRTLVLANARAVVSDLMDENVISVGTLDDIAVVADMFAKYDLTVMPVVDGENRLVGIVTVDDAIDVMRDEATEDIEKMAAITPSDKPYPRLSVTDLYKSRIPWLLLLMLSAVFTQLIIGKFEAALAANIILTSFIPMLMDTGGNSGSQACVTVIRGISLDEIEFRDIFKVVWKEIRVAVLCGICLAIACFGKIMLVDHMLLKSESVTTWVALVVSLSMAVTVFLAKLVGGTLPLLAKKLGFDPAVMASPIITTIVDFLSLLVYFTFATTILHIG